MSCEITDKETGDRVNWAAGTLFWIGLAALVTCACASFHKGNKSKVPNKVPVVQMIQTAQQSR